MTRRFRWASLQIERLNKCPNENLIKEALRTLPRDLEQTYQAIVNKIVEDGYGSLARPMLMLLCFPAGPLHLKTVASLGRLTSPAWVVEICTSYLLSVSGELVKLAHYSVKEFLVNSDDRQNSNECCFFEVSAHETLAMMTVDSLLEQNKQLDKETAMSQPFLVFAAVYWSTYTTALRTSSAWPEGLQDKVDRLFTEPTVYFNWLRIADNHNNPNGGQWNWLPEECPLPIYRAIELSLTHTVDTLVKQGINPLEEPGDLRSPLDEAVATGRFAVVSMLLKKNLPINSQDANDMIRSMDTDFRTGENETLTGELQEVLRTMWDMGLMGDQSQVTNKIISEEFIRHSLMNHDLSVPILSELLDWREAGSVSFTLPEDTLSLAMSSSYRGDELMTLLLQKCDSEIHVPPDLFSNGGSIGQSGGLSVLMHCRVSSLIMTDDLVSTMASTFDAENMEFVLQARSDIRVTEDVLESGAHNRFGLSVFRLLWDRRDPGTSITNEVLCVAAGNRTSPDIMQFVIDKLEPGTNIDEEVLGWAHHNDRSGLAMFQIILGSPVVTVDISENLITRTLFKPNNTLEILELLVDYSASQFSVTEAMVGIAAQHEFDAFSLLNYLNKLHNTPIPVTSGAMLNAINSGSNGLEILLDNYQGPIPEEVWVSAALEDEDRFLRILLDRNSEFVPLSRILAEFMDREPPPTILKLLLDRKLVKADETLLEAVAGGFEAVSALFTYDPSIRVTYPALTRAAVDPRSMRLLLDKDNCKSPITEDIIIRTTEGNRCQETIESIIRRRGPVPITQKVFEAALSNGTAESLPWLLEQRPDLNLSPREVFEGIWRSREVSVDIKLQAVEGFMWLEGEPDALLGGSLLASVIELHPYDSKAKENYGLREIVEIFFVDEGGKLPASDIQRVAEIIVERGDNETVRKFLEAGFLESIAERLVQAAEQNNTPMKDDLIRAAEKNVIADREPLISLLSTLQSS